MMAVPRPAPRNVDSRTPRGAKAISPAVPPWLRYVLFGGALWICVALVRGVTFALTHAAHGL